MTTDVLSHFAKLNGLIQTISRGSERFVLVSRVNAAAWTVHVGLQGPEGKWWKGTWTPKDILDIVGTKPKPQVLDGFSEKLSKTILDGGLMIDNRNPESSRLDLILGPSSRKPLHIPLVELSATEAASYAMGILIEMVVEPTSAHSDVKLCEAQKCLEKAEKEITALKAELARKAKSRSPDPMPKPVKTVNVPKGQSLANPHKKARKYKELEFASDGE